MTDSTPAVRSPSFDRLRIGSSVMPGTSPLLSGLAIGRSRAGTHTNGIDFRLMERLRPVSSPRPTSRGPTMAPDAAAAGGEQVQPLKLRPGPRPGPGFPARGRGQAGAGATVRLAPPSVPVNDRWYQARTTSPVPSLSAAPGCTPFRHARTCSGHPLSLLTRDDRMDARNKPGHDEKRIGGCLSSPRFHRLSMKNLRYFHFLFPHGLDIWRYGVE